MEKREENENDMKNVNFNSWDFCGKCDGNVIMDRSSE